MHSVYYCGPITRKRSMTNAFYIGHCFYLFVLVSATALELIKFDDRSPYHQHLPTCSNGTFKSVQKKTTVKGIVCPMIRDEIGFLSEWTAFYEMQGFDHIIFYDNNSNTSLSELDPWVKSGFVTIERNWWDINEVVKELQSIEQPLTQFANVTKIKEFSERQCKQKAIDWGYEIFVSVDLDEYLLPQSTDKTVMDELVTWFDQTKRGFVMLDKYQYSSTPHFLEPVNMLTIEAYQMRVAKANKLNYYKTVVPKVALRLQGGADYTADTSKYLVYCCNFHGCGTVALKMCKELVKSESSKLTGKRKKYIMERPFINHYSRSLEKYMMKQVRWEASGDNGAYDNYNLLERTGGFLFDNTAVVWGCQLRELLRIRTGEETYLRPGDMWYRNPEFGKIVSDPRKRGRRGAKLGISLPGREMSPYPEGEIYQKSHKSYNGVY